MPRASYRYRVNVYRSDQDENSPEDWVLSTPGLSMGLRQLSPREALAAAPLYNPAATHEGRCEYHADVLAGRDKRLIEDTETGAQYLVLGVQELRRRRGGRGDLVLTLHRFEPPWTNLVMT